MAAPAHSPQEIQAALDEFELVMREWNSRLMQLLLINRRDSDQGGGDLVTNESIVRRICESNESYRKALHLRAAVLAILRGQVYDLPFEWYSG